MMCNFRQNQEVLGKIRTVKPISVPGKCMVKVKCKTKVSCDMLEKDVLIQPLSEFLGDGDLMVCESVTSLKRGRSKFVNIAVYNQS